MYSCPVGQVRAAPALIRLFGHHVNFSHYYTSNNDTCYTAWHGGAALGFPAAGRTARGTHGARSVMALSSLVFLPDVTASCLPPTFTATIACPPSMLGSGGPCVACSSASKGSFTSTLVALNDSLFIVGDLTGSATRAVLADLHAASARALASASMSRSTTSWPRPPATKKRRAQPMGRKPSASRAEMLAPAVRRTWTRRASPERAAACRDVPPF